MEKKQKILTVALAALVLGTGSAFLLTGSQEASVGINMSQNTERKVRKTTAEAPARATRKRKSTRKDTAVATVRKSRTRTERKKATRHSRRGSQRKEKKKEEAPAA